VENIFEAYFRAMPCFLTTQDRDLWILDADDLFVKNFGDYRGRHCYQVYKRRPEKCEQCPVERTFRDGEPHHSEEVVTTLDGRSVSVIVYTMPIRDEQGNITSVMEMSTDITDIKLLQDRLRENENRYRLLFEEVPCYISIQDSDLNIVEANRLHREAFGTNYGKKCFEVYKHRDKECLPCTVRQTFMDGRIYQHEEVVTALNGEQMNVLVCTAPIRNASGQIEKVVEMSADVTQVRMLQDKLSSIGLLISSIAHGVKGLLNGLDGGIYLVNSGLKQNNQARVQQGWEMAERNVSRIRSMVLDILYYAKDRDLDLQPVDPRALLDEVCSIMKDSASKLGIEVECSILTDVETFDADHQAMRSLLVNLIENSLDACRIDGGKTRHKISIRLKSSADDLLFEITDDGVGMDKETREKAFTMFFSSKGAGGTGLGLFVSNKIAQAHGGEIRICSQLGKGTCFSVQIPIRRRVMTAGPEAPGTENNSKTSATGGE
jgi:PAS domain S-box-containing protein